MRDFAPSDHSHSWLGDRNKLVGCFTHNGRKNTRTQKRDDVPHCVMCRSLVMAVQLLDLVGQPMILVDSTARQAGVDRFHQLDGFVRPSSGVEVLTLGFGG